MPENKHLRFFISLLYVVLGAFLLWLIFKYAIGWFAPFIIAFIFSRIIEPPVTFFEKRFRFPRPLASIIFTLLCYGIIGTAFYFASSKLVKTLVLLFNHLKNIDINLLVEKSNNTFMNFLSHFPIEIQDFIYNNVEGWISELLSALQKLISPIVSYTANIASLLPSILIFVIAAIVSTYFLSCDYKTIRSKILNFFPEKIRAALHRTKLQVSTTLLSYLKAISVLICITFVELAIGLSVLRVSNSILIAAIIAIIDALPLLGTGWILLPWAIFALISENYFFAIGLAVIYAVVLVIRNLIEPKIVGENIGLHPLATLASMYIGLKLFGIIGMLMPIPVSLAKKFYEWGYFDFFKHKKSF